MRLGDVAGGRENLLQKVIPFPLHPHPFPKTFSGILTYPFIFVV